MTTMLRKPIRGIALAALLTLSLASFAIAGQVLKLTNGDLIPGEVVEVDDKGVLFRPDGGGSMRVPWDKVHTINRYELWKATLGVEDTAGRVELSKWCLSAKLYRYARRELVEAQGLGYEGKEDLEALISKVNQTEADDAIATIDAHVEAGRYEEALATIRRYRRDSVDEEQDARVRKRIPDIVARMERRDELEKDARKTKLKKAQEDRKKRWVESNLGIAARKKTEGITAAVDGFSYLAKGNQTRARRGLKKAEDKFDDSRGLLKRVKRAVRPGSDESALIRREMDELDRRTLEVLTRWGSLEVDNKSWKKASPIVDRGLKIDPVNVELLRLREIIDKNWIRRKLSGITNAEGRQSNN